jgi:hypothetical protein
MYDPSQPWIDPACVTLFELFKRLKTLPVFGLVPLSREHHGHLVVRTFLPVAQGDGFAPLATPDDAGLG